MSVFKPPKKFPKSIFLAGSIEMGAAVDWQEQVTRKLQEYTVFNPRRDDWDSSWEQSITNPQFHEQVSWELEHLERADVIIIYFAPDTKSPISLLELGLFARSDPQKLIVVCPDGFWRKGNVDIICERYDLTHVPTLEEAVKLIKDHL